MANTNDMNAPTKVPCGGFVLGEGLALSKDGKTLNVTGGGVQSDWNQNDETAVDYVKNRPGGYDVTELVTLTDETIAPNQTHFSDDSRPIVNSQLFNNIGKTIYVTYDGVLYECPVIGSDGSYRIGDSTFAEYPFFYFNNVTSDEVNPLRVSDPSVSHTIKIELYEITPVVFNRKYIPDLQTLTDSLVFMNGRFLVVDSNGIPKWTAFKDVPVDYAVIKSSTSGSSKKFKITVDDTGTIKATEVTI